MTQEQTYVHGDIEVKKTGRKATKPLPGGKMLELVEITPFSEHDGLWKKFVPTTSLLTISGEAE